MVFLVSLVSLVILRTKKTRLINQALKVLNEPGLPDFTISAKSLVNQGIPGKLGRPGHYSNQENQT